MALRNLESYGSILYASGLFISKLYFYNRNFKSSMKDISQFSGCVLPAVRKNPFAEHWLSYEYIVQLFCLAIFDPQAPSPICEGAEEAKIADAIQTLRSFSYPAGTQLSHCSIDRRRPTLLKELEPE
jgi:hypothetical protein